METKKEVIKYIVDKIEPLIPFPVVKTKDKTGTVTFELKNGCKIIFYLDTVLGGSKGKKSFVLTFSMALYNPFFAKIRREAFNKIDDNPVTKDLVFTIDYGGIFKGKDVNIYERYMFSEAQNKQAKADEVIIDIQKYFFPYIEPFLVDYSKLVNLYELPDLVKNMGNWWMFINGVIACILTKQENKIEELIVPLAKSNTNRTEFLEFKKTSNYKEELVEPIRNYIKQTG